MGLILVWFSHFHRQKWGKMNPFDEHSTHMGWNHRADIKQKKHWYKQQKSCQYTPEWSFWVKCLVLSCKIYHQSPCHSPVVVHPQMSRWSAPNWRRVRRMLPSFLDEKHGGKRERNNCGKQGLPHHYMVWWDFWTLPQTGRVSRRNFKKTSRLVKYWFATLWFWGSLGARDDVISV